MAGIVGLCDLTHLTDEDSCTEQFAGVGTELLVFKVSDLAAKPIEATDDYPGYAGLVFKEGKGAYRMTCKEDANKIDGETLGFRKGFKTTGTFIVPRLDNAMITQLRKMNNQNVAVAVKDGDDYAIIYSPDRKVTFKFTGGTGDKAESDRQCTISAIAPATKWLVPRVKGPITICGETPAGK